MSLRDRLRRGIAEVSSLRAFEYSGAGAAVARLDCNELPLPLDADEMARCRDALGRLALHRYPEVSGRALRESLARRWGVEADQILLGNGSMEVLSLLMTAFGGQTARGAATVLFPDPSFPMFEVIAKTHGLTPVAVPLDEQFRLDEEQCARTMARERPVLSLFASPNNPTGNRFDEAALIRLARQVDGAFVVDEAYADFSGQTLLPRLGDTPSLLISRSLSKIGLAGLRLGALVGSRDVISELDRVRLPWNVNAVSLALGTVLLEGRRRIDERIGTVVQLRTAFEASLRGIPGLCVYPSEANFILVRVRPPAGDVERRLIERAVIVKNVSRPGPLEGCLRITVGTADENARCEQALRQALVR